MCEGHLRSQLGLCIAPSLIRGAGYGLFVADGHTFMRGGFICPYEGEKVESPSNAEVSGEYVLQLDDATFVDARATTSCAGRYSNTCAIQDRPLENNAQLQLHPETGVAWVVATRLIAGGHEVYTDYNSPDYFE
jgi:hypothetical protein